MSEKRFVLDTNILISAALFKRSLPSQVVDNVIANGKFLQSQVTLDEFEEVLHRRKFDKYVSIDTRMNFLNQIKRKIVLVSIAVAITDCRDPKDNKFLEFAVSGEAEAIISGDEDLLVLHPFRDIAIITPAEFLEQNP